MKEGDLALIKTSAISKKSTDWFVRWSKNKDPLMVMDVMETFALVYHPTGRDVWIKKVDLEVLNEN